MVSQKMTPLTTHTCGVPETQRTSQQTPQEKDSNNKMTQCRKRCLQKRNGRPCGYNLLIKRAEIPGMVTMLCIQYGHVCFV